MRLVHGVSKRYAWGDTAALPRLLGKEPDGWPLAEVWFGTHPAGPATIDLQGGGSAQLGEVAGRLPYLLKLLAAAEPLSLQAHPTAQQAADGFAREEAAGITGPERIFVDPDPKPEIICALSSFEALCGFRPPAATDELLRSIGGDADDLADRLVTDGLEGLVTHLMVDRPDLDGLIEACASHDGPVARWLPAIAKKYPGDPAIAVTLLLNHVVLRPGQALYLSAGNLHAYLQGTGVEVMGASDNVIRGGMTVKHVDVIELLRTLDYTPLADPVVRPERLSPTTVRFPTPGAPFVLYGHHAHGVLDIEAQGRELVLCAAGSTTELAPGQVAYLEPGEHLVLHGTATIFRVAELG
jgi:mannose-6-phosphate isomerase